MFNVFNYLLKLLTSKNPNLIYLQILIILAIIFLAIYLYKITESPYLKINKAQEGFQQDQSYILKQNQFIYDEFYAEMYDGVNNRDKLCQRELFQIIKMTEPSANHSVFLDIGSGTGCVVNELTNAGYDVYGIDKSEAMTEYAESKNPNLNIKVADALDAMSYEKGVFTHVMCLNFTIYELDNKLQFFRNCYHWMKPNSYLILHLVNPGKFSTKKYLKFNTGITSLYDSLIPETENENVRKTSLVTEFSDCTYEEKYAFSSDKSIVVFSQVFTDKITKNIRQNEQILKMESIDEILDLAKRSGFIVHGKTGMKAIIGDDNQYLYVLERTL